MVAPKTGFSINAGGYFSDNQESNNTDVASKQQGQPRDCANTTDLDELTKCSIEQAQQAATAKGDTKSYLPKTFGRVDLGLGAHWEFWESNPVTRFFVGGQLQTSLLLREGGQAHGADFNLGVSLGLKDTDLNAFKWEVGLELLLGTGAVSFEEYFSTNLNAFLAVGADIGNGKDALMARLTCGAAFRNPYASGIESDALGFCKVGVEWRFGGRDTTDDVDDTSTTAPLHAQLEDKLSRIKSAYQDKLDTFIADFNKASTEADLIALKQKIAQEENTLNGEIAENTPTNSNKKIEQLIEALWGITNSYDTLGKKIDTKIAALKAAQLTQPVQPQQLIVPIKPVEPVVVPQPDRDPNGEQKTKTRNELTELIQANQSALEMEIAICKGLTDDKKNYESKIVLINFSISNLEKKYQSIKANYAGNFDKEFVTEIETLKPIHQGWVDLKDQLTQYLATLDAKSGTEAFNIELTTKVQTRKKELSDILQLDRNLKPKALQDFVLQCDADISEMNATVAQNNETKNYADIRDTHQRALRDLISKAEAEQKKFTQNKPDIFTGKRLDAGKAVSVMTKTLEGFVTNLESEGITTTSQKITHGSIDNDRKKPIAHWLWVQSTDDSEVKIAETLQKLVANQPYAYRIAVIRNSRIPFNQPIDALGDLALKPGYDVDNRDLSNGIFYIIIPINKGEDPRVADDARALATQAADPKFVASLINKVKGSGFTITPADGKVEMPVAIPVPAGSLAQDALRKMKQLFTASLNDRQHPLHGIIFPTYSILTEEGGRSIITTRPHGGYPVLLKDTNYAERMGFTNMGNDVFTFWTHLNNRSHVPNNKMKDKLTALSNEIKNNMGDVKEVIFVVYNGRDGSSDYDYSYETSEGFAKTLSANLPQMSGVNVSILPVGQIGCEHLAEKSSRNDDAAEGRGNTLRYTEAVQVIIIRGDNAAAKKDEILRKIKRQIKID